MKFVSALKHSDHLPAATCFVFTVIMNFVETNPDQLIVDSKSKSTLRKTESDMKLFKDFLVQIRGVDLAPESMDAVQRSRDLFQTN